jgi:REP element-mobilizing transposase RayT
LLHRNHPMRYWLITSTTYGTWLPGDRRGFVSAVTDGNHRRVIHNTPNTPYDADMPAFERAARQSQKASAIWLDRDQALILLAQFQETAKIRGWELMAVAILSNHFHVVVAAGEETASAQILGDLKSYGSRALNRRWGKPAGDTWWTASGSKRPLPNDSAVLAAIRYVEKQRSPLVVWSRENSSAMQPDPAAQAEPFESTETTEPRP